MNPKVAALAARVVEQSTRTAPADGVLRKVLRGENGLTAERSVEVSRAVFAYFRWRGWLSLDERLPGQLGAATALARQFTADPSSFSEAELVQKAVPSWISSEVEVTPAWARALQREPILWLRARPGQAASLAERLGDCQPMPNLGLDSLQYCGKKDLFRTAEFHSGLFELQDLSSQVVGVLCGPGPGETWWDACAGEGGKTLHLCDLMGNKGLVWASDRATWRLERLKRRASRAQLFNYRSKAWDGSSRLPTKTLFDGVLVDAPCSGIGTWGRNPHARWTTSPADVSELAQLQTSLLEHAAKAVKPGGKLIYAVCTLTRSETTEVVARFEALHTDFAALEMANPLAKDAVSRHIWLRPESTRSNGMFTAAWRKNRNAR